MTNLLNITETHKRAMNYMAAESAVASVWVEFQSATFGPMLAKIDRCGNILHPTQLARFANEDAKNEWIAEIEG